MINNILPTLTALRNAADRMTDTLVVISKALTAIAERTCAKCEGSGRIAHMSEPMLSGEVHQVGTSICKSCNGKGY